MHCAKINLFILFQLWSGKWCIKDEHKLLSDLGSTAINGNPIFYDTHNGFPVSSGADSILYDNISTIAQSQNSIYTQPIGTPIGKFHNRPISQSISQNEPGILGSSSLTHLSPITMQDIKLGSPHLSDEPLSPFQSGNLVLLKSLKWWLNFILKTE